MINHNLISILECEQYPLTKEDKKKKRLFVSVCDHGSNQTLAPILTKFCNETGTEN